MAETIGKALARARADADRQKLETTTRNTSLDTPSVEDILDNVERINATTQPKKERTDAGFFSENPNFDGPWGADFGDAAGAADCFFSRQRSARIELGSVVGSHPQVAVRDKRNCTLGATLYGYKHHHSPVEDTAKCAFCH